MKSTPLVVDVPAVAANGLCFGYNHNPVLNGLSLSIPRGKIYALLGPNGCGKTTLLKLILGRIRPKAGTISLFGSRPGAPELAIPGPGVGYMPQEIALYEEFTATQLLTYYAMIYNLRDKNQINNRIEYLKRLLNLSETNRTIRLLSGGQKRLVSLSIALFHEPRLLILDEPTVGVDSMLRFAIWTHLRAVSAERGQTVIITTHYIEEANDAGIVGFIRDGKLISEGDPTELKRRFNSETLENVYYKSAMASDLSKNRQMEHKEYSEEKRRMKSATIAVNLVSHFNLKAHRLRGLLSNTCHRLLKYWIFVVLYHFNTFFLISVVKYLVGQNPSHLPVAILNNDISLNLSRLFLDNIESSHLRITDFSSKQSGIKSVVQGRNLAFLEFPTNFTENFETRVLWPLEITDEELTGSQMKLSIDSSNAVLSTFTYFYLIQAFSRFLINVTSSNGFNPMAYSMPLKTTFIHGDISSYSDYMIGPTLLTSQYMFNLILSAFAVMFECNQNRWARDIVAGVKPIEIFVTYLSWFSVNNAIQTLLSVLFAFKILSFQMNGEILLLSALLYLQGLTGTLLGMLIALVADRVYTVIMILSAIVVLQSVHTGLLWPIEAQPSLIYWLSVCTPQTLAVDSVRSIMFRGLGLTSIQVSLGFVINLSYIIVVCAFDLYLMTKL